MSTNYKMAVGCGSAVYNNLLPMLDRNSIKVNRILSSDGVFYLDLYVYGYEAFSDIEDILKRYEDAPWERSESAVKKLVIFEDGSGTETWNEPGEEIMLFLTFSFPAEAVEIKKGGEVA